MSLSKFNGIKRHFIMIFDHSAQTEPIVIIIVPSFSYTQSERWVKEAVTSQAEFAGPNIP